MLVFKLILILSLAPGHEINNQRKFIYDQEVYYTYKNCMEAGVQAKTEILLVQSNIEDVEIKCELIHGKEQ